MPARRHRAERGPRTQPIDPQVSPDRRRPRRSHRLAVYRFAMPCFSSLLLMRREEIAIGALSVGVCRGQADNSLRRGSTEILDEQTLPFLVHVVALRQDPRLRIDCRYRNTEAE